SSSDKNSSRSVPQPNPTQTDFYSACTIQMTLIGECEPNTWAGVSLTRKQGRGRYALLYAVVHQEWWRHYWRYQLCAKWKGGICTDR
ncbi:MAG: hypothetical protein LBB43_05205, partial [Spirochaetaceae bacterium]|nr:hypothetical protein [Spirochaetaceae bacterium]